MPSLQSTGLAVSLAAAFEADEASAAEAAKAAEAFTVVVFEILVFDAVEVSVSLAFTTPEGVETTKSEATGCLTEEVSDSLGTVASVVVEFGKDVEALEAVDSNTVDNELEDGWEKVEVGEDKTEK